MFHLDWKLMIAQVINLGIVVFVLWFIVFKPLAKKISQRSQEIEKGLENAKQSQALLDKSQKEYLDVIMTAREKAKVIFDEAEKSALKEKEKILLIAKEESEKISKITKENLLDEKEKIMKSAKKDLADLVVLALEKTLGKAAKDGIDKDLIENSIRDIANTKDNG